MSVRDLGKWRKLTKSYDRSLYTNSRFNKAMRQIKETTKLFDYMAIKTYTGPVWTSDTFVDINIYDDTMLKSLCLFKFLKFRNTIYACFNMLEYARRGGAEVAGWSLDRKIRVRFPAYPHRVWALWWQGGKRCLQTSRCPCRDRLGTLKTPSCPWRWVPGSRSKFGNWTSVPSLYSWNIAECDVKPQSTTTTTC